MYISRVNRMDQVSDRIILNYTHTYIHIHCYYFGGFLSSLLGTYMTFLLIMDLMSLRSRSHVKVSMVLVYFNFLTKADNFVYIII